MAQMGFTKSVVVCGVAPVVGKVLVSLAGAYRHYIGAASVFVRGHQYDMQPPKPTTIVTVNEVNAQT